MGTPTPSTPPDRDPNAQPTPEPGFVEGLANHLHLGWRCQEEAYRASRYRRPLSLLLIELTASSPPGAEEGLRRWLRSNVRMSDTPAYLGGGRYALLLPETGDQQARAVETRLLTDLGPLATRICSHPRDDLRKLVEDLSQGR